MKLLLKKGVTSQTALLFIQDKTQTDGRGLAGLAYNTATLTWYYYREGQGTGGTQVTLATQTLGIWATGGFVEVDATDMPGWYEIGIPNAALATGADFVGMQLKGGGNMAQINIEIELIDVDLADAVRMGLTALPNAAADAAGGLPVSDAGGLDLDAQRTEVAAILVDTGTTLDGRLPAALVGGRMDASIGAMAADTITNSALATSAVTEMQTGLALETTVQSVKAKTDNLPTDPADHSIVIAATDAIISAIAALNDLSQADIRAATGLAAANLDTQLADLPTNAELAVALAAADDAVLVQIALIKAKSDLIPAAPAAVGDIPTAIQNADALLKRDWTGLTGEADRSVLNALRAIRNKWWILAGLLYVTKEDDTTVVWTSALSSDAAADPIIGSDPT